MKLNDVYGSVMEDMNKPKEEAVPVEEAEGVPAEPTETEVEQSEEVAEQPTEQQEEAQPQININEIIRQGQAQAQQLRAALEENARLKAAVAQSGNVVKEQGEVAEKAIVNAPPQEEMPEFPFERLNFMSPEEAQEAFDKAVTAKVNRKMSEIENKLKPVLEKYDYTEKENRRNQVVDGLSKSPNFPDFAQRKDRVEAMAKKLQSDAPDLDYEKLYTIAYLMDKGMEANKPKTTDDIVKEVMKNPEALKRIREQSAKEQVQVNQSIPRFSAAGNSIPATPQQKPERLENIKAGVLSKLYR